MSWHNEWMEKEDKKIFNRYKRYLQLTLESWFYYNDPIEIHEWQMIADTFIKGGVIL